MSTVGLPVQDITTLHARPVSFHRMSFLQSWVVCSIESALFLLPGQAAQYFRVCELTEHFKDINRNVCVHMVQHANLMIQLKDLCKHATFLNYQRVPI